MQIKNSQKLSLNVLFAHGFGNNIAGQELSLIDRMQGLRALGVDCEVLLPESGIFADLLVHHGFNFKVLPFNRLSRRNPFPYFRTIFQIYKLIKRSKYTHIHCIGAYPNQCCLPAARMCGVPCFVHINTTIYQKHHLIVNFVKYADRILCVSQGVRGHILRTIKINHSKVVALYDAISKKSDSNFSKSEKDIRLAYHIPHDYKIVGQLSTLIPLKGCEYFLRMAKIVKDEYPKVKFMIIGRLFNDDYERFIRKEIETLGLQSDFILTGYQSHYFNFIDALDISVLASLAEGLGRVIVESQMSAKPVVATDLETFREVIKNDETGFLVPARDPQALSIAVLSLLRDPEKAKRLGENAQKLACDVFNIERHAQSLLNEYRSFVKPHKD